MDKLKKFIQKVPLSRLIYASILLVCAIIVSIVFFFATRFLTSEINRVFMVDSAEATFSLDIEDYRLIARTLGLPEEITPAPTETITAPQESPASTTAITIVPETLDKGAITIEVLNATSIRGLAGKTKDMLVTAGFSVAKTGNAKAQSENSISIKAGKESYLPLLREALGASFADASVTTNPEDSTYDVVIIVATE